MTNSIPDPISVYILTDIPVWTRPLERALGERGATVRVGSDASTADGVDVVVNRLSSGLRRISAEELDALIDFLQDWESAGKPVINNATCLQLGLSKIRQYELFRACGVETPATALAAPGGRVLPDRSVLLKHPAGGYGKGIRRLEPGEPAPQDLDPAFGWVEQEIVNPADGMVHRIELVGTRILYNAATPLQPDCFDYCLANTCDASTLLPSESIDPEIVRQALQVAERSGMQIGAIEYFLLEDGSPCFFDLNPVSSLHPKATALLGVDPIEVTAEHVLQSPTLG